MQRDLRGMFPQLVGSSRHFPCLRGCDEYSTRMSTLPLETNLFTQTVLMSGDFGDAYTLSQLARLTDSIPALGHLLGYSEDRISLIRDLVSLIFENCYFFTPFGLYKQGRTFIDNKVDYKI